MLHRELPGQRREYSTWKRTRLRLSTRKILTTLGNTKASSMHTPRIITYTTARPGNPPSLTVVIYLRRSLSPFPARKELDLGKGWGKGSFM